MKLITVDDTESSISYVGGWTALTGSSRQWESSVHSVGTVGATATFRFTGSSVMAYTTIPVGSGTSAADFTIDGGTPVRVSRDIGSQAVYAVLLWNSGSISYGDHTLVITDRGTGNFQLDRLRYNQEDDGSDSPATPSDNIPTSSPNTPVNNPPNNSPNTTPSNDPSTPVNNNTPNNPADNSPAGQGSSKPTTILVLTTSTVSGVPKSDDSNSQTPAPTQLISGNSDSNSKDPSNTSDRTITNFQTISGATASGSADPSQVTKTTIVGGKNGFPIGAIVGIVLGVVLCFLVLLLLIVLRRRKLRRQYEGSSASLASAHPASVPKESAWSRRRVQQPALVPYSEPPSTNGQPGIISAITERALPKSSRDFDQIPDHEEETPATRQLNESSNFATSNRPVSFGTSSLTAHRLPEVFPAPSTHFSSDIWEEESGDVGRRRPQYLSGATLIDRPMHENVQHSSPFDPPAH